MANRIGVAKTHKLYINGEFPRSESGRTYEVHAADGTFLANTAMASRKDLRDAVSAARKAVDGWSGRTAYNRGQIIYRVAEMLEHRRAEMAADVAAAEGLSSKQAQDEVAASIDRLVWYAGWTDKLAQVFGNANDVAGPYFNVSTPEPTGIVGVLAPQDSSLLGMVSVLAPPLAGGNVVVAVASFRRPTPAVTLAEILATSDVPAGVVNILTGDAEELGPVMASHMDIGALDLTGAAPVSAIALQVAAADSTKRIIALPLREDDDSTVTRQSWHTAPTTARMRGALELKTVWHPAGL